MQNRSIKDALSLATEHQLSLQSDDGYWWYTLEATEYICAEYIFLMHFMGEVDGDVEAGLARRIISCQRPDGTWSLYYGGPPDLSTTIECYWALKLHLSCIPSPSKDKRLSPFDELRVSDIKRALNSSLEFILSKGGITHARIFTKIHMALFGLVPWDACPAMPPELMLMPTWSPVTVYEFSSWARACIIPLLIIMKKKPVRPLACHCESRHASVRNNPVDKLDRHTSLAMTEPFNLDELFAEPASKRSWEYKSDTAFLSWERFFINLDKVLKVTTKLPISPFDAPAIKKCEEWIREHIERTEDIFPALVYGAMALSSLGHTNSHPTIRKALNALKSFQQSYEGDELPATCVIASGAKQSPARDAGDCRVAQRAPRNDMPFIHQQCCISPVWDTPWQLTALLEAGVPSNDPRLLKAGRWLISKQITKVYGDWKFKNPDVKPGGWSFEFENDYFPDVDDTIQVLHVLNRLALPEAEKVPAIKLGLEWVLSMQNDDGGWGAFDKNQNLKIVNRIPFSDHGACLDPSSPDIAGRMIALLAELGVIARSEIDEAIPRCKLSELDRHASLAMTRALDFLSRTQENFGAWSGRWGVNYIYGTWCVLTGLAGIKPLILNLPALSGVEGSKDEWQNKINRAIDWLISIQHEDGGFSEHPESYRFGKYLPYPREHTAHPEPVEGPAGIPSQTAWALMGLIAGRDVIARSDSDEAIPRNKLCSGDCHAPSVLAMTRAAKFLTDNLRADGTWDEKEFTGTGFPNHFYIRYHGYRHFFPLLALGRYSNSSL